MYKNLKVCCLSATLIWVMPVYAEQSVVTDYLANVEEMDSARSAAKDLLSQKPQKLQIKASKPKISATAAREIAEKNAKENPFAEAKENLSSNDDELEAIEKNINFKSAPFDLLWGAPKEYMQHIGWLLTKAERDGYENVFQMKHKEHTPQNFDYITATFGANNKLWCIYAESKAIEDDASASKVLALYEQYHQALAQKYGNAEVHFEPYTYEVEQPLEQNGRPVIQNGRPLVQIVTIQNPLGGENFLQELQEQKAILYSTFHDEKIGVTLSIYVDDNSKSHLLIDYKNLPLMNGEEQLKIKRKMEGI